MRAHITGVSYVLPETIVDNAQLAQEFPSWSVNQIAEKTGIVHRHIASEAEYSLDLAERAAKKLFSTFSISVNEIDCLILCTQTPKYLLPTGACILQSTLGLPNAIAAFDINLGCSGYIYLLSLANSFIQSRQAKKCWLSRQIPIRN